MKTAWVAIIMMLPALAGCLSGGDDASAASDSQAVPGYSGAIPIAPEGAELKNEGDAVVVDFGAVALPFSTTIEIPEGTTVVRATVEGGGSVRASMLDETTGRRRCNSDTLNSWGAPIQDFHACSGVAAIDPPGATWIVGAAGPADVANVRIEFYSRALDGAAAMLDLSQLSMPAFDLLPTTGQRIQSFDGVPLWVETTLPVGEGPWPTVIASSPYNGQSGRIDNPSGTPAMWSYFTHDWARRGYAVVNADVRGFGLSGGCVEVWGINEQKDQKVLVDWVAQQPWSDGNVGFYGQSYVGTTPVAAAVQAPEALKAIIAVAPVISAYDDWHYGGVPNGENLGSPVAYQVLTDLPTPNPDDPINFLDNTVKGVCDPTLVLRANDPRAIYDDYYIERDFKLRADQVKAAVLFTEGFEDSNVKSAMIPGWFNEIEAPKLGVFGHWVHQHPTRADEEILFLGWMDQYVKGRPVGFDNLPNVLVSSNVETTRGAEQWPDLDLAMVEFWPDFNAGVLSPEEASASDVDLVLMPAQQLDDPVNMVPSNPRNTATSVTASILLNRDLAVSGVPHLNVRGTLNTQGNAYLAADLVDVAPDGTRQLVSYGMFNLAHQDGHDTYNPRVATASDVMLPFLPTEWVFEAGHSIEIELRGVQVLRDGLTIPGPAGVFTIGQHSQGMGTLSFHEVPLDQYQPMALAAQP